MTPGLLQSLAEGVLINAVLAAAAFAVRGMSVSGAVWGGGLGTLLYGFAGWQGFILLAFFFALGTAATRAGQARKAALGIAQEQGGRRGARHVFANAGVSVLFAVLAAVTAYPDACRIAMASALATATGDTVSSEIGKAYGRRHYLVTGFREVPAGTEGAVSLEGTLAGASAALILALIAWSVGLVPAAGAGVVFAAALVGATVESYLAAALNGVRRLDHHLMNFINTAAGAVVALLLWLALFTPQASR